MKINSINLLIPQFKPKYENNSRTNQTYPNLAPLKYDTVSFSGRRKLLAESMRYAPAEKTCRQVNANAEPARFYLESVLNKYIAPYTQITGESSVGQYPILKYSTRTKSPTSIREKVVSKYTKNYKDDSDKFVEQAADLFMQNFQMKPGVTKEILISDINNIVKYSSIGEKIPPYQNVSYYLSEIMSTFSELERFDFSECSAEYMKSIFSEMVDTMELRAEKDHSIDSTYVDPESVTGIKHYAKDIVGARITMRESTPEYTSIIIEALKQAVRDGALNIVSIENNIPDPKKLPKGKEISDYKYVNDSQLRSLAKIADAPLIQNKSQTGYMGIHINVDLSNPIFSSYNGIYNGFSGEIQIIGSDVEELKDVEDLCYKLKDNKNAIHVAYMPFKTYFLKYYNDKTKEAFDDYTYALYLSQRTAPPGLTTGNDFPSIDELGFGGKVPPELDFNILRQLKRTCDIQLDVMEQNQSSQKKTPSNQEQLKTIKSQGDIKTLKSLISYIIG